MHQRTSVAVYAMEQRRRRTSIDNIIGEVVEVADITAATSVGSDRIKDGRRGVLANIISIIRYRSVTVIDGRKARTV